MDNNINLDFILNGDEDNRSEFDISVDEEDSGMDHENIKEICTGKLYFVVLFMIYMS